MITVRRGTGKTRLVGPFSLTDGPRSRGTAPTPSALSWCLAGSVHAGGEQLQLGVGGQGERFDGFAGVDGGGPSVEVDVVRSDALAG